MGDGPSVDYRPQTAPSIGPSRANPPPIDRNTAPLPGSTGVRPAVAKSDSASQNGYARATQPLHDQPPQTTGASSDKPDPSTGNTPSRVDRQTTPLGISGGPQYAVSAESKRPDRDTVLVSSGQTATEDRGPVIRFFDGENTIHYTLEELTDFALQERDFWTIHNTLTRIADTQPLQVAVEIFTRVLQDNPQAVLHVDSMFQLLNNQINRIKHPHASGDETTPSPKPRQLDVIEQDAVEKLFDQAATIWRRIPEGRGLSRAEAERIDIPVIDDDPANPVSPLASDEYELDFPDGDKNHLASAGDRLGQLLTNHAEVRPYSRSLITTLAESPNGTTNFHFLRVIQHFPPDQAAQFLTVYFRNFPGKTVSLGDMYRAFQSLSDAVRNRPASASPEDAAHTNKAIHTLFSQIESTLPNIEKRGHLFSLASDGMNHFLGDHTEYIPQAAGLLTRLLTNPAYDIAIFNSALGAVEDCPSLPVAFDLLSKFFAQENPEAGVTSRTYRAFDVLIDRLQKRMGARISYDELDVSQRLGEVAVTKQLFGNLRSHCRKLTALGHKNSFEDSLDDFLLHPSFIPDLKNN